jgi:chromosome segregation ATPase
MEPEQIVKRLEWLDEERRKDKNTIADLEERIHQLEAGSIKQIQQVNEVSTDVARMMGFESNIDLLEAEISKLRVELGRSIETIEKQRMEHDREVERIRLMDVERINKNEQEVHVLQDKIEGYKKEISLIKDENLRLARLLEEIRNDNREVLRGAEEFQRNSKMVEENRRNDSKRLTDLAAEVTGLRKRVDEQRNKQDVFSETLRKIDLKTAEIQNTDSERKQSQIAFMEKQNTLNVERERVWKDWQTKFNDVDKRAASLDTQIQNLDSTFRAVKRSQEALDEVTQRFERRINEITEMQRLSEDRFRNEWNGFKADDQKRWATFSLTQEEQQRETNRTLQKASDRLLKLEDSVQDIQYQLQQVVTQNIKRLQSIMALMNQYLEGSEE